MNNDAIEGKRAALVQRLDTLAPNDRLLLHILAVAAEPLNTDMVLLLVERIRLSGADASESPTLLTLKPVLQRLRRGEFIASNNLINPLLVDVLVREVFADTTTQVVVQPAAPKAKQQRLPLRGATKAQSAKALPSAVGLAKGIVPTIRSLLPTSHSLYSLKGSQLTNACHRVLRELRLAVCGEDDTSIAALQEYLLNSCQPMLQNGDATTCDPLVQMVNNPF